MVLPYLHCDLGEKPDGILAAFERFLEIVGWVGAADWVLKTCLAMVEALGCILAGN
jgi:hypothetical protein